MGVPIVCFLGWKSEVEEHDPAVEHGFCKELMTVTRNLPLCLGDATGQPDSGSFKSTL